MSDSEEKLTPMMRQYRESKKEIPPDAILLFRLGDFYEMFFEDAAKASKIMGLVLTKRAGTPMCGFPYHALDVQLPVLLAAGVKVAIAEQLEDPKTVGNRLVKRAITRIITPGTVVDSALLRPEQNNFLAALDRRKEVWSLASLDISTGEFKAMQVPSKEKLVTEMNRLAPNECLIRGSLHKELGETGDLPCLRREVLWTELDDYVFEFDTAQELLKNHFHVATLDAFGIRDNPCCVSPAGALLYYAKENLRQDASHVGSFTIYNLGKYLELDSISQRNLELVEPLFGTDKSRTLLGILNRTMTPMGGRLLYDWILRPLYDHARIVARLDAVEQLKNDPLTSAELRDTFGIIRDLERIVGRINLGSANARDMVALGAGLGALPAVKLLCESFNAPLLDELRNNIGDFHELVEKIGAALVDAPPLSITDGEVIRKGYCKELDEFREAATGGKSWIAELQARESERTGIKSLKIKYNGVFGYFIEVSKSNLSLVPEDYIRRQTIANGERFTTPELKEVESKILGAEEKGKALENKLFTELREYAKGFTAAIQHSAAAVAFLDVLASLADVANACGYIRPRISDGEKIEIVGGRHPVLDALLPAGEFVPNDLLLDGDEHRMMIITGPNMAGKSTYIRQTALLVIMAQIGSFIPASSAEIGLVDRIFTRVGAADDLSRGQSTFMVEMVETANILLHSTNRSLVILDEIGRGTSTFDGVSIAWAVAEFLHDDPHGACRTLFATHYHELTALARNRRGINNFNVAVKEYGDQIIFLRQIVPGSTDRSYGIHVAKLAGLPESVVKRAGAILEQLESANEGSRSILRSRKKKSGEDGEPQQMSLF